MTSPFVLHLLAWSGAFVTALLLHRGGRGGYRLVLGLALGALVAKLGWGLLHLPQVLEQPRLLLHPGTVTVLFAPLGLVLVGAPRDVLGVLPAALVVARLGCLGDTCCYPSPANALPELAVLAAAAGLARSRVLPEYTAAVVFCGIGLARLAALPFRLPESGLFIGQAWICSAWISFGVLRGGLVRGRNARSRPLQPA